MDAQTGHCQRCKTEVELLAPWSGYVWVKRVWYAGLLVLFALMPIVLSEITILLPMALMFALAVGPVHALAAQKATCMRCGAEVQKASRN